MAPLTTNPPPQGTSPPIRTRFIILSDTHGLDFPPSLHPQHSADVAIHCGDLTEHSRVIEFLQGVDLLSSLDAPLKLVVAGNHDFTLDIPVFKKKFEASSDQFSMTKRLGDWNKATQVLQKAREKGVVFLQEGSHRFVLGNGAVLNVYASPYTPSSMSEGGFQYSPQRGHDFAIQDTTDVVITHGPPKGILDVTYSRIRAGCPDLFAAVARARPKMHCFGHIHEAWGARLVAWRDRPSEPPSHFTHIDDKGSVLVADLAALHALSHDDKTTACEKAKRLECCLKDRCSRTSHCADDEHPIQQERHTLFVNAAIKSLEEGQFQLPWLVDIDLHAASADGEMSWEMEGITAGKRKVNAEGDETSHKFQKMFL